MELTKEMEIKRAHFPAKLKSFLLLACGGLLYLGVVQAIKFGEVKYTEYRQWYIESVIADYLNGRTYTADDKAKTVVGDPGMTPAHLRMVVYALDTSLRDCRADMLYVNDLTNGIRVQK